MALKVVILLGDGDTILEELFVDLLAVRCWHQHVCKPSKTVYLENFLLDYMKNITLISIETNTYENNECNRIILYKAKKTTGKMKSRIELGQQL